MKLIMPVIYLLSVATLTSGFMDGQKQATGSIRGQIYADRIGMLFSEVEVKIYSADKLVREARTDQHGDYQVKDLPAGHYTAIADLRGTRLRKTEIDLERLASKCC